MSISIPTRVSLLISGGERGAIGVGGKTSNMRWTDEGWTMELEAEATWSTSINAHFFKPNDDRK